MKVVYNKIIPMKGFKCVNLFGVVFVRRDAGEFTATDENHEAIHTAQMKELGYVFFYLIYLFEWLFRLVFHTSTAYHGISFEVEACEYMYDYDYLTIRRHWAQWRKRK